jgi:arylsulfatase A-like enzyme
MKNIILIIADTFRYDNLGQNSHLPTRTPWLEKFAAERAVSLGRCYSGSFPTIPHRTDIATGRINWPNHPWQDLDLSGKNHIAKMLSAKGYLTQLIGDCPHLLKSKFDAGFDASVAIRGQESDAFLLRMNYEIQTLTHDPAKTRPRPTFHGHSLGDLHRWQNEYFENECGSFASRTAQMAIRFLEDNYKCSPFFLWVDMFDPHEPWDPPEYMVRRYQPDYTGEAIIDPNYGRSSAYTPEELMNMRAHYCAESELVDRCVGRILEKIDDLQLWDDTIICFTSDHGTSLGDHGRTGKSSLQDDDGHYWPLTPDLSHIPLMFAGSGIAAGTQHDFLVHPTDILPTMLELADATLEPPEPFHGHSLASVLHSGTGDGLRAYTVAGRNQKNITTLPFLKMRHPREPRKLDSNNTPFVITDRWGFAPVGTKGKPELYDLKNDPRAEHSVYDDNRSTAKDLLDLFYEHLREANATEEVSEFWQDAVDAALKC